MAPGPIWEHLHPDEDGPETKEGLWSYMITEDSDAFQYRALLSTKDSALTPKLADISLIPFMEARNPLCAV